jgi:hypothetical protein
MCTPEVTHATTVTLQKLLTGSEGERKAGRDGAWDARAFVLDSFGLNVRAQRIAALRHPRLIPIPFVVHVMALICGDYLSRSRRARVIQESECIVHFFNSSTSVWLPLLRTEMTRTLGSPLALVSAVATRWTSTWISSVSVIQANDGL